MAALWLVKVVVGQLLSAQDSRLVWREDNTDVEFQKEIWPLNQPEPAQALS